MRKVFIFFLLMFVSVNAQFLNGDIKLPKGLSLSNQLEYAYDTQRDIQIMENWLNLDYRSGIFATGVRFEAYQPNDPDPSISRGKERYAGIAFKYIEADIKGDDSGMKLTLGNYYALFGRGLILRSYEDRNIRIDNNLLGVKIESNYKNIYLTALTGMPANAKDERKDVLTAVDLEYAGISNLNFGTTYATNFNESNSANTSLASVRVLPKFWNFEFYGEYGIKLNDDIKQSAFNDDEFKVGEAYYTGMNFYFDNFSLSAEYKHYDNYLFQNSDGTVNYNTPPAARKDYSYVLLNRHPSPLNQASERGFQVEANYYFSSETFLTANFGITNSLDASSYYQRSLGINLPSQTQLKEAYVQLEHVWGEKFETIFALGYTEELSSDTKNIIPIIEAKYYIDDYNTLRFVVEHMQSTDNFTNEKFYDDVLTLEYLSSPDLSISLVSEMKTTEPVQDKIIRKFWNFIQIGYSISSHTDLRLLIGTRQAGNICISGVCRYEPEFKGVELKLLTRLF